MHKKQQQQQQQQLFEKTKKNYGFQNFHDFILRVSLPGNKFTVSQYWENSKGINL